MSTYDHVCWAVCMVSLVRVEDKQKFYLRCIRVIPNLSHLLYYKYNNIILIFVTIFQVILICQTLY